MNWGIIHDKTNLFSFHAYSLLHTVSMWFIYSTNDFEVIVPFCNPVILIPFDQIAETMLKDPSF